MNKVLIICGPTATGKTKLAAHLAKKLGGELVSADSRQVYRGMDLVTGKERVDVPIWLYDVVDPDEEFSVSHWVKLARAAISDIAKRGNMPIVVGGTGLYIQALLRPFETINIPPNKKLREKLAKLTVGELQEMVTRRDMNASDWYNPRRLIRKIEIAQSRKRKAQSNQTYDVLLIGLTAPLGVLDKRIDERLEARKQLGMDAEEAILRKRFSPTLPAMTALGLNEHAYARRQMTWFKKQSGIMWFDIQEAGLIHKVEKVVKEWYTK
jgi:tRNA dimethylallyltransferase